MSEPHTAQVLKDKNGEESVQECARAVLDDMDRVLIAADEAREMDERRLSRWFQRWILDRLAF